MGELLGGLYCVGWFTEEVNLSYRVDAHDGGWVLGELVCELLGELCCESWFTQKVDLSLFDSTNMSVLFYLLNTVV